MEGNISVNLTESLELIANKLGVAAKDILPEYQKLEFAKGVINFLTGILIATVPWILRMLEFTGEKIVSSGYNQGEYTSAFCLHLLLTWFIPVLFSAIGILTMSAWIENLYAPRAMAISRLLNDVS